jgi:hypothetical protein
MSIKPGVPKIPVFRQPSDAILRRGHSASFPQFLK